MDETAVAAQGEKAPDPRELLRAARRGDGTAGTRLIELWMPRVYSLQRSYARLRASALGLDLASTPAATRAAEDTALRTVAPLILRLCRYRAARALEPWVWRIGLNVAFSRDPQNDAVLTPGHAAAYLLRAAIGLEVEAISAVLGSPPDSVGPRIAHARRVLLARATATSSSLPGGCVEYQASVDAWMEDLLLGRERRELEEHLDSCRQCGQEAEALRGLDLRIRRAFEGDVAGQAAQSSWIDASARMWTDECAGLRARREAERRRRHTGLAWVGALLALALVAGFALLRILR